MLVSEDLAATGTLLIWVVCAATGATVTSGPKDIYGSMFLLKLGSVMMSMAHVPTRVNRNHSC